MKLERLALGLMILLLPVLSACSPEGSGEIPASGTTSGEIVFEDDFSDPASGWDRESESAATKDYVDGAYRIQVNRPNFDVWATPGGDFLDLTIEVEAQKVSGPDENDFGVICRYQNDENFYFFLIASDGFWGIGGVFNGEEPQLIEMDGMEFTHLINPGAATDLIRAECEGSVLRLYVNGTILGAVTDTRLTGGDIGLIAGTFDTPGTEISFDNLVVRNP